MFFSIPKGSRQRKQNEINICQANELRLNNIYLEFDPGSGQTLAACIKHASRTEDKCCTS